jgi:hypothetical protein
VLPLASPFLPWLARAKRWRGQRKQRNNADRDYRDGLLPFYMERVVINNEFHLTLGTDDLLKN